MLEQPLLFLSLPFGVALATHILASVSLGASLSLRVPDRVAQVAPGMLTAGLGLYSWSRKEFGQVHAPLHRDRRGYWLGGAVLVLVGLFWNGAGALTPGYPGEIRWDWLPALLPGSLLGG